MFDLIPISRVYLEYKPSSVAINQITYSGIILGESKDLHFFPNSDDDDGFYEPHDEDTNLNRVYNGTDPSTVTVSLDDYPNLKDNYSVDYTSVSLFDTATVFIAMYRSLTALSAVTTPIKHTLVPLSADMCIFTTKDITSPTATPQAPAVSLDSTAIATGTEGAIYSHANGTLTLTFKEDTPFVVPGSYVMLLTFSDGAPTPTLTYVAVSDRDLTTLGDGDITPLSFGAYDVDSSIGVTTSSTVTVSTSSASYAGPSIVTLRLGVPNSTGDELVNVDYTYIGIEGSEVLGKSAIESHSVLLGMQGGDKFHTIDNKFKPTSAGAFPGSTVAASLALLIGEYATGTEVTYADDYVSDLKNYVDIKSTETIITFHGRSGRADLVKSVESSGLVTFSNRPFTDASGSNHGLSPRTQFSFVYIEAVDDVREMETDVVTSGYTAGEVTLKAGVAQNAYHDDKIVRGIPEGSIPLYTDATKGVYDGVHLEGTLHLGYIAENHDPTILNNVILVDSNTIESIIGYPDPRNPLGFACRRTLDIIGDTRLYVMPIDTSTNQGINDGLGILSNYIDIFQVYLLVNDYSGTFDTWLEQESDPDNSRFRIGMNPTAIEKVKTFYDDTTMVGILAGDNVTNYTFTTSTPGIDFGANLEVGATMLLTKQSPPEVYPVALTVKTIDNTNSVTFIEMPTATVNEAIISGTATKKMNTQEIADYMYNSQQSDNMWLFKILSGKIDYTYTIPSTGKEKTVALDTMFNGLLMFGPSVSTPPHQPLTSVVISGYGYGRTHDTTATFARDQFSKLVSAGYYVLTTTIGAKPEPYCLRDASCGLKQGTSLNGTLPKIKPVALYAKDIFFITKQFLGKNNVVDDVIQEIQMRLEALRRRNLSRTYKHLGTVLAKATEAEITIIPNGLVIRYGVSPQDQLITIDNYVTVTDAVTI